MSVDGKGQRFCDECGRTMRVAVRIHQGAEYCRCCYGKVFLQAQCPVCKQSMRRHRHAPDDTPCEDCKRAERVCLRCHRLTPRAARIVDGQAVCSGCVSHFNEAQRCTSCGELSQRLFASLIENEAGYGSWVNEGDVQRRRICQPCKTKPTHATCMTCRRHRKVASRSPEGKPLCGGCSKDVPETRFCPGCGAQVPGGGAARCFNCIRRDAAKRMATMLGASLDEVWCRNLWHGFVDGLTGSDQRLGAAKALIGSAIDYFRMLEVSFDSREAINSASLHQQIESQLHRKHLLAYRFLLEGMGLAETKAERAKANEDRRLTEILQRSSGLPSASLLRAYLEQLQADGTAQRTVRLYAGVAQRFCESTNIQAGQAWPEGALERFLEHTPGAANSLSKLVTYCRRTHGLDIRMPPKAALRTSQANAKRSVDRLRQSLARVKDRPPQELKLLEVCRVIAAATGLSVKQLVSAQAARDNASVAIGVVLADDARIEPGHPLHPFACRWATLIASRNPATSD